MHHSEAEKRNDQSLSLLQNCLADKLNKKMRFASKHQRENDIISGMMSRELLSRKQARFEEKADSVF